MPGPAANLTEQYLRYTYPYSFFERLADIRREVARRRVRGVVPGVAVRRLVRSGRP
jgi:hypothetical protein